MRTTVHCSATLRTCTATTSRTRQSGVSSRTMDRPEGCRTTQRPPLRTGSPGGRRQSSNPLTPPHRLSVSGTRSERRSIRTNARSKGTAGRCPCVAKRTRPAMRALARRRTRQCCRNISLSRGVGRGSRNVRPSLAASLTGCAGASRRGALPGHPGTHPARRLAAALPPLPQSRHEGRVMQGIAADSAGGNAKKCDKRLNLRQ